MHQNVLKIQKMYITQIMENWEKPFDFTEANEKNIVIIDNQKDKKSRNALKPADTNQKTGQTKYSSPSSTIQKTRSPTQLHDTSAEQNDIQVKVQEVDDNLITLKEIPQGANTLEIKPIISNDANKQSAAHLEEFTNMEVE